MKTISNEFLTGAMYAPFCRTKAAPMEEWEQDMKNMSELGYGCAHGFAEWHEIEYEKGKFDFSKIDHFVKCAWEQGIAPIINVATQNSVGFYSPRWLMEELRDCEGFVDSMGNRAFHSEYVVPCLDDPAYAVYANRFLSEVARHFAGDERVSAYVLWGEPTLHSPFGSGSSICYCRHTKEKFRNWMREKYNNDISIVNERWGLEGPAYYSDFSELNPPTNYSRQRGGYCSWDDWRDFMEDNLAGHIKNADTIFKQNGALQPTIVEMMAGINNSIDSWKLAETVDIIGISLFGKTNKLSPLYMTVSQSIAKACGKTTFVIEAGGGCVKYDNPTTSTAFTPTLEELKTTLMLRAGFGTRGLMYWCWRPRLSDVEGNDFGMCRADGKPIKRTQKLGKLASRLRELSPVYLESQRKSDVAIFMSQKINHIMTGDRMVDHYVNSLIGALYMMNDLHINADYISENAICKGNLKDYKVLLMPCSYVVSKESAKEIEEFVKNGGTVIADYILAEKEHGGICYTALPGAGLDKVFGIEREDVFFISHPTFHKENTFGIKVGSFVEEISLHGAASLEGNYLEDSPIITKNSYGKGNAIYIATQYFKSMITAPTLAVRERMLSLLKDAGVSPYIQIENEDKLDNTRLVTSSLCDKNGELKLVTVSNLDFYEITDTVTLPLGEYESVDPDSVLEFVSDDKNTYCKFTLGALSTFAVYRK